ncbi:MAG: SCO family protein [Candidatus Poseidoniaceae archaeon]|jgi:protein SCO1/2|nr:SCO family protein [Candidatus Poseidoniaceae archaeon]
MRRLLVLSVVLTILSAGCLGHNELVSEEIKFNGKVLNTEPDNGFNLTSTAGGNWSLENARGKVVILLFTFTHCTETCPIVSANVQWVLQQMSDEEKEQVQAVSVTMDPWRDTPEVLGNWSAERGYDWIHLTGNDSVVLGVLVDHYIFISPTSEENYDIAHQQPTFLLDRDLNQRILWNGAEWMPELVLEDVRTLLAE